MTQYHKIQTLFLRDPGTSYRTLLEGQYAKPEFEYLAGLDWVFTEKIDGTNIRVIWDGEHVKFAGKTDRAQIPPDLLEYLHGAFPQVLCEEVFTGPIVLYGEGYGPKIQGGGDYVDEQRLILFDAYAGGMWLRYSDVSEMASALGIPVVPLIGVGPLSDMVLLCKEGFYSRTAVRRRQAEGIVARPVQSLLNRQGHRVITKLKFKDFPK